MTDLRDTAAARARAEGKHIGPDARTLGRVDLTTGSPERAVQDEALAGRARDLLREEIERVRRMRAQLAVETAHGAPGGRARIDSLVAAVEGATRFALQMGLVTPGEARVIWADARAAGLRTTGNDDGKGT